MLPQQDRSSLCTETGKVQGFKDFPLLATIKKGNRLQRPGAWESPLRTSGAFWTKKSRGLNSLPLLLFTVS